MPTHVQFPEQEILRSIQASQAELEERRHELLTALGTELLALIQIAYDEKSSGRSGSDGVTWKPLKAETRRRKVRKGLANERRLAGAGFAGLAGQTTIGVDTGLQRASGMVGFAASDGKGGNIFSVGANDVTVGYGREYSVYFDRLRTLIPENLPPEWVEYLEGVAVEFAEMILNDHFLN